jgi:hypothetical protein
VRERLAPLLGGGGGDGSDERSGRLRLLQHDDAVVRADPSSNGWVNTALGSRAWWNWQPFDKFLLMQVDSAICRPGDWEFLHELTSFDYAGSPWGDRHAFVAEGTGGKGGNGGFSWRSRAAALSVLEASGGLRGNEDTFFSGEIGRRPDLRMAPTNVSCRFGVETWLCDPTPFGVHSAWVRLPRSVWADFSTHACPAAATLVGLTRNPAMRRDGRRALQRGDGETSGPLSRRRRRRRDGENGVVPSTASSTGTEGSG